jgi:serine/threonine-protein kinase RsbW
MSSKQNIKLIIESKFEQVEMIGNCVNKLCSVLNYNETTCYDIELCCVEAVNNCIKHAYNNSDKKKIELVFSVFDKFIEIKIIDTGIKASFLELKKDQLDFSDINDAPENGMGLIIINQVMDKVSYERIGNKNILCLIKHLNS